MLTRFQNLWALLFALLFWGCASTPPAILGADGRVLDNITFEGVERFSKSQLTGVMYSKEDTIIPFAGTAFYDEALATSDSQRIVELYRAHGYYHARILDIVERSTQDTVSLHFVVEEGPVTTIRSLSLEWATTLDEETTQATLNEVTLQQGEAFEVQHYNESLGFIRQTLQNRGYPLADSRGDVIVDLSQDAADIRITIEPNRPARIGQVHIEGLVNVPEAPVQVELEFARGESFSPARLFQMEESLRAMRVFSWVSAQHAPEIHDGLVDVVIQVSEADPHSIRIGAELSIDTLRWQEQLRLDYTHTNLFGELTRLDLEVLGGWAQLPNPWATELNGPVASFRPRFTKKGLLERHLLWSLEPKIAVDLEEGYQYWTVRNRLGVSRWFAGRFLLGVGQAADFVDFFNLSPELDQRTALLGRDFRDPYLLSSVELNAAAFFVDHIMAPTNGVIVEATYNLAGPFVLSDFDFHKTLLTMRAYLKPFSRLQLASRIRGGLIVPYGDDGAVPFNQRYYLGGATSMRGWGSRRLSPRIQECIDEDDCLTIPIGGYSMIQGNFEARVEVIKKFHVIGFFDVGDVQADTWTIDPALWNYSAGPGLRLDSPFGTVRLDLGFRLNDPGIYTGEPGWGIYFGLGQTL